jgi:hypothetical protein
MRICYLLLSNSFGPWDSYFTNGVDETWKRTIDSDDVYLKYQSKEPKSEKLALAINRILFSRFQKPVWSLISSFCGSNSIPAAELIDKSKLEVAVSENWSQITRKTIGAMKFCIENFEFDFLVRANSSCLMDTELLKDSISRNAVHYEYAGPVQQGKTFVSGWCIILSRESVEKLVKNYQKSDSLLFDDEAIGKILSKEKVFPAPLPHFEIKEFSDYLNIPSKQSVGMRFLRLKNDSSGIRVAPSLFRTIFELERSNKSTNYED